MDEDEVECGFRLGGGRDGYVSFGRRETNTFRSEMVESKKLGTSADSKLIEATGENNEREELVSAWFHAQTGSTARKWTYTTVMPDPCVK